MKNDELNISSRPLKSIGFAVRKCFSSKAKQEESVTYQIDRSELKWVSLLKSKVAQKENQFADPPWDNTNVKTCFMLVFLFVELFFP